MRSPLLEALARPAAPDVRARRTALAHLLADELPTPDPAERAALEALAGGDRPVLAAGQQAGLLLGPFLSVSKILALLALADHCEALGLPRPVTVFWLEANDHDWREAATPGFPMPAGWSAPPPAESVGRPVGHIRADAAWWEARRGELAPLLDLLDEPLRAIATGSLAGSLADHTRRLLRGLLPGSGLLVLDPSTPAARRQAAPFLARLQDEGGALAADLSARTAELAAQGLPTPVQVDGRPPWFQEDQLGRRQRAEVGERAPAEACSPNALTRPLLQDWWLDPAAVLLGPTEHAYLAQATLARRRLGLPTPLALRRPTLQVARREALDELASRGLDPWAPPQPGQPWPADLLAGLPGGAELREDLRLAERAGAELAALCARGARPDLEQLGKRHAAWAEQLRQALEGAHKARHKETLRRLHALATWQDAPGAPQERRVNALALLARMGGLPIVDGLRRAIDPLASGQQRFVAEPDGRITAASGERSA